MLNLDQIKVMMTKRGLSQAGLADLCNVSREAVSNWLSGESIPRPNKLKALSEVLDIDLGILLRGEGSLPKPVLAYRTKNNRVATGPAMEAAEELARHLRELAPFVGSESLFSPPVLESPKLDDDYIRKVAQQIRSKIGLTAKAPVSRERLLALHHAFGSILVPVLWNGEKRGHENALSVYLPESKTSWVVFSLNAKNDDFNYWLAHELGHCYSLHALQGDDGESFAERFAQELLFPHEASLEALGDIANSASPLERAVDLASAYDISVVTVIRQSDRAAKATGKPLTGLENDDFWTRWNATRTSVPTVGLALFGSESLSCEEYVVRCEKTFGTPIFKAIASRQHHEGWSPSFISSALNIGLEQAVDLSRVLMTLHPLQSEGAPSPKS
ncbi:MAG: helix-turn-helix family protein [Herminiimonas sp.]|nr:helix-turn-helix family protein [Herminiimonas sp.]MDB5854088.1 helix-turn-helix family protein [Herminiimonas sp.]